VVVSGIGRVFKERQISSDFACRQVGGPIPSFLLEVCLRSRPCIDRCGLDRWCVVTVLAWGRACPVLLTRYRAHWGAGRLGIVSILVKLIGLRSMPQGGVFVVRTLFLFGRERHNESMSPQRARQSTLAFPTRGISPCPTLRVLGCQIVPFRRTLRWLRRCWS
jgi:hypothetical protein